MTYDDWKTTDAVADELAEADAQFEVDIELFADDLFEAYVDGNPHVVTEVDEELIDAIEHVLCSLRESFDNGKGALQEAYGRAVALACRAVAHSIEDRKHLERFRRECDV